MDNSYYEQVLESIAEMTLINHELIIKLDAAVIQLIASQKQHNELLNQLTKNQPVIRIIKQ